MSESLCPLIILLIINILLILTSAYFFLKFHRRGRKEDEQTIDKKQSEELFLSVKKLESQEAKLKILEIQWQDHFQTRAQTWKALEVAAILAVALVGLDWNINNPKITIVTSCLLLIVSLFGSQITIRHRNSVMIKKFQIIRYIEKELGMIDDKIRLPDPINWWTIFLFRKSNTPLFILRMHFVIQLFAVSYLVLRLCYPAPPQP